MAVTRIKNNQITDASGANTQLGVNAAVKLQNYSVTASKLANSLTYGSDLTITGNLTVNGQTTTVDTVNTLIKDPIITLADGQTSGTPTVDIGLLGLRGNQLSSFIGWNEANTQFAVVLSNTTASNTTVNITQYADFKAANILATGNLSVAGNIIGGANFTGNVTAGNLISVALVQGVTVSASGNVIGGNINTAGLASVTGNVIGGNILTGGIISSTGNLTAGNISTAGNVTAANFIGNISGNIDAAGSNTQVQFNDVGDILGASANFTFNKGTNVLTVSNGNIVGGNILTGGLVSATGNVNGGNLISAALVQGVTVSASGNVIGGNVTTGGLISATGNATAGNVLTGGLISATSTITSAANITGGNVLTGGLISATSTITSAANITGGNVLTGGLISATSTITSAANITGGNVLTGGLISATGNIVTSANIVTNNIVGSNVTITSTGIIDLVPTGNIAVNSRYINNLADPVADQDAATKAYVDSVAQGLDIKASVLAATDANLASYSGGTISYNNGTAGVGATLTTTGTYTTIDGANVQTVGTRILVKNEGNATFNGIYVYSNATVLTRSADFNQPAEVPSAYTFVETGTTWADTGWVCTTNAPVTFGTSNITFVQFSGAGSYTANTAAGISLTGTVFSALVDNNTTAFSGGGNIIVKAGANLTTPNIGNATGQSLQLTTAGGNGLLLATTVSSTGNTIAGNVLTGGLISATGNATAGNVLTGGLISATSTITSAANITGGNVLTGGLISATSTITSAANITGGNVLTGGLISATGNITGANINGTVYGNVNATTVSASGNVTGGNILTGGLVSATGNATAGNVLTGGLISATSTITSAANITGGNLLTGGLVSATGNATAGNVLTGGLISATSTITSAANITGGNLLTGGLISATSTITSAANITGANILTGGLVSATGTGTFGNIVLTGNFINQLQANSIINVNGALANTNFAVNGTAANVFFVNASANTASFGTSAQTTNALVAFNTTTSIKLPAGTTGQRPATGVTGMFRFNSTTNGLELYNNTEWAPVGSTTFTVIADEQFNGDGSTVAFTLATSQTTNSCIVSINGVVQIPTSAYSVTTTTLTFTEAPAAGDLIDVREITTTTTVSALSNGTTEFNIPSVSGNATVSVGGTANVLVVTPTDVIVTGNLTVTGNATLSGNILGDRIQNGTTTIDIQSVNGNANVTVGGTSNVAVFSPTMVTMAANLMPAANITYDLGSTSQRWKDLWLSNSTIYLGNSQISANATALIFTNPAGGQTVLAGATAAITATTVSATGNVTGANVVGTNVYGIINTNSILNSGSNGTGNIGSASTYFNTLFAKATSAQYADLAEKYVADAEYAPGTVVSFGGEKEITRSEVDADRAVAGVVSTNPSYIMNATLEAEHVAVVAFTGRVPTSVTGTVAKGDLMVSNGDGTARSEADPRAGSIIGKALENFAGGTGVIEVVIGRF